ncbi:MAG: phage tail protein [Bradymonadia bacterium]
MGLFSDNRRKHDHIGNFNFKVEIDGVTVGAFRNVEGLDAETEVVEYQDGDDLRLRKRPGRTKYSDITLKRGYISTMELWDWRKRVMDGVVQRKSGSIVLCNDKGDEVMRYNFYDGWPSKWKGFTLDGKGTDAVVEEISISHEYLERVQGSN